MDRAEIPQRLAAHYAQFVDDRRFAAMDEIMWPELTQQGPGFGAGSRDEFVRNLEVLRNYDRTFHILGQQFGDWDGDTYHGEAYCVASHFYRRDGAERRMDMGIRYRDVIDVRDGVAKYSRRDLNVVWTEDRAVGRDA